ncbi:NAD(P)-dependent oxidoreductase [Roseicyclus sp.]|uniref:NAD(P)-dependent oxidoreductase n=1 Tax=Roseicyclus sp. TaxID=1914329 RepID=UPI003FA14CAC
MNVIVFGATGSVGRLAVAELLAAGNTVTAFARHPERLGQDHPELRLHAGDALVPADVAAAMPGQDAVLVVLGAGASRRSRIRSEGTLNVIRAMQAHGPRRLVVQSTLGARDSRNMLNFWWKRVMFGLLLAPVYRDHELQERLVEASGLDWTIVRPSAFTDAPTRRPALEDPAPGPRGLDLKVARSDLARLLGRLVAGRAHLHRAVALSS